ncbi:hypothetical protein EFS28_08600 [Lactobacillus acidophilus]|uniref:hypothetical protein n=1 Tax=Lactobacillus acidophilus TaxID=1579 RepID=UPI0021A382A1|nr:hypothetical protein [Lactobacillus acidophilus]MCT3601558.1 hypothetical protein [Lactobacillus acidophilus]MCT3624263.1 hypothetical protein [Lactobacillus acidophilus]
MKLMTSKEMMEFWDYSKQTFRRRRRECEKTQYRDAILQDGPRKIYVNNDRWKEFVEYRNRKYFEGKYGITDLRNNRKFV